MSNEEMKSRIAIQKCASWLAYCLSIGWHKKDLNALDKLWWEYHDWRTGNVLTHTTNQ